MSLISINEQVEIRINTNYFCTFLKKMKIAFPWHLSWVWFQERGCQCVRRGGTTMFIAALLWIIIVWRQPKYWQMKGLREFYVCVHIHVYECMCVYVQYNLPINVEFCSNMDEIKNQVNYNIRKDVYCVFLLVCCGYLFDYMGEENRTEFE